MTEQGLSGLIEAIETLQSWEGASEKIWVVRSEVIAVIRHHEADQATGWRDISTAPKDGTVVLLWGCDKDVSPLPYARTSRWDDGFWRGVGFIFSSNATHWMPIPPPPAVKEPVA